MIKIFIEILLLTLLSIIFIFIISPIGLLIQIYENLKTKIIFNNESYRINSVSRSKENIENMY